MRNVKALIFKITCSDKFGAIRGRPYRKIAFNRKASLYELACAAISSFDFQVDEAFGFYDNLKKWFQSKSGYESYADMGKKGRFPGTKETKITKVFRTPKQKLLLIFDYEYEWRFIVEYMETKEIQLNKKFPVTLLAKGESPKRYIGSGGGFYEYDYEYEYECEYEYEHEIEYDYDIAAAEEQN